MRNDNSIAWYVPNNKGEIIGTEFIKDVNTLVERCVDCYDVDEITIIENSKVLFSDHLHVFRKNLENFLYQEAIARSVHRNKLFVFVQQKDTDIKTDERN